MYFNKPVKLKSNFLKVLKNQDLIKTTSEPYGEFTLLNEFDEHCSGVLYENMKSLQVF